jgi:hypothetical protein
MVKQFYCVPRIDIRSYDPITKDHKNAEKTSEFLFEGTFIDDHATWRRFWELKKNLKIIGLRDKDEFFKQNMNKFPVVTLDFFGIRFEPEGLTRSEIYKKFLNKVIIPAFRQYDYVLFLYMAQEICEWKYGNFSKESIERLYTDFRLNASIDMGSRISKLWSKFKNQMPEWMKVFYSLYSGDCSDPSIIEVSLFTLTEILERFYGRKVIVLVDEHDAPVQEMHKLLSSDDLAKNNEVMKAIKLISDSITDILKNVGKSNPHLEKFLMFGISNGVVKASNSGFNNLEIFGTLNPAYSEFFSMTENDVEQVVNRLFPEKLKQREAIKANIFEWYNGYYGKDNEKLSTILSSILYISDCYASYIETDPDSCKWVVPQPKSYWTKSTVERIYDGYYSIGLDDKFSYFLQNLAQGSPTHYADYDSDFAPLIEEPSNLSERGKKMFHLLVHYGYLTLESKEGAKFKFPNKEIEYVFLKKLSEYLDSYKFGDEYVTDLLKAVATEDFESLGKILTKFVKEFVDKDAKNKNISEHYMHNLILNILVKLHLTKKYVIKSELGMEGIRENRGKIMDIIIAAQKGDKKTHYIIELKRSVKNDDKEVENKALVGLKQIFNRDYFEILLPDSNTEAIIAMGLATHYHNLCLAPLKVYFAHGNITNLDNLKHQRFWIDDTAGADAQVNLTEQKEHFFNLTEIKKNITVDPTDAESDRKYIQHVYRHIADRIELIQKEGKGSKLDQKPKTGDPVP